MVQLSSWATTWLGSVDLIFLTPVRVRLFRDNTVKSDFEVAKFSILFNIHQVANVIIYEENEEEG